MGSALIEAHCYGASGAMTVSGKKVAGCLSGDERKEEGPRKEK